MKINIKNLLLKSKESFSALMKKDITLNKKNILNLTFLLATLISIPLTLVGVKQNQELQKDAFGSGEITLSISSPNSTISQGDSIPVKVLISSSMTKQIYTAGVEIDYNAEVFDVTGVTCGNNLPLSINTNLVPGKISLSCAKAGGQGVLTLDVGKIVEVGTFQLSAKTTAALGQTSLTVSRSVIPDANSIDDLSKRPDPVSYNIVLAPTPTSMVTPTLTPTLKPTSTPTLKPTTTPLPTSTIPPPADPLVFTVDDNSSNFKTITTQDTWIEFVNSDSRNYHGTHHYNRNSGTGSDKATWSFTLSMPGRYEIYSWWWAASYRPTDVPYTINYLNGSTTVRQDQTQNGGMWNLLGTFDFSTQGEVFVTDDVTNGQDIVADAIRVVYVGPLPTPTIEPLPTATPTPQPRQKPKCGDGKCSLWERIFRTCPIDCKYSSFRFSF